MSDRYTVAPWVPEVGRRLVDMHPHPGVDHHPEYYRVADKVDDPVPVLVLAGRVPRGGMVMRIVHWTRETAGKWRDIGHEPNIVL